MPRTNLGKADMSMKAVVRGVAVLLLAGSCGLLAATVLGVGRGAGSAPFAL